jgi:hypothetical protein
MANSLIYKPQAKRKLETGGINFSLGTSPWKGVAAFAQGIGQAVSTVDALLDHMDAVEDENNMYGMLSDLDIGLAQSAIDYESTNPNPDDYSKDMMQQFSDAESDISGRYKFKRADQQATYNKLVAQRKTQHTLAVKKRELILRTERATAMYNENNAKDLQAAITNPSAKGGRDQYIAAMTERGEIALGNGVTTREKLQADIAKGLNEYDWYQCTEDIEGGPEIMIERLKSEEETLKWYPSLAPNQITKARKLAKSEKDTQDKYDADKEREFNKKWSEEHFGMVKELEEATTPEEKLAIKKRIKDHVWKAAGHKSDTYVQGIIDKLNATEKKQTSNTILAKLHQGIKTGKLQDPDVWREMAIQGVITTKEADQADKMHEKYLNNHGRVDQWDEHGGIYEMALSLDKDKGERYHRFINTMQKVQEDTGWESYNPDLKRAAEKLLKTMGKDEIPVSGEELKVPGWGKKRTLDEILEYEYAKDVPFEKEWAYSKYFDFRIPTANEAEIKFVNETYEKVAREQRREGVPVTPKTRKNMQLILNRKRGKI